MPHSESSLGLESGQTRALLVTWAEPAPALRPRGLINHTPRIRVPEPGRHAGRPREWVRAASQASPGRLWSRVSLTPSNRGWTWAGVRGAAGCRQP